MATAFAKLCQILQISPQISKENVKKSQQILIELGNMAKISSLTHRG